MNEEANSQSDHAQALAPWRDLALSLPSYHTAADAPDGGLAGRVAALPPLEPRAVASLSRQEARRAALDVLMIEAAVRRHGLALGKEPGKRLSRAVEVVAARIDCAPIITYPLYIRVNPIDLRRMRRFTPLESEFRFIRMHRLIEDQFDGLIDAMSAMLDAPDPLVALASQGERLVSTFRLVNQTMAGFRGRRRMPRDAFVNGFRPYYEPRLSADGRVVHEGPSGLQSPTYRMIAMLVGLRDAGLDGWTERISPYHEPHWRDRLAQCQRDRDAGRSLAAMVEARSGAPSRLPRLHPRYGRHVPVLADLARRRGYLAGDVDAVLVEHGVTLGAWPAGVPEPEPWPPDGGSAATDLTGIDGAGLETLIDLEAMLFALHVEHVATTAAQIGHVRGTGGTSGVEFLLLATFRRAFPALWESGVAGRVASGMC